MALKKKDVTFGVLKRTPPFESPSGANMVISDATLRRAAAFRVLAEGSTSATTPLRMKLRKRK